MSNTFGGNGRYLDKIGDKRRSPEWTIRRGAQWRHNNKNAHI